MSEQADIEAALARATAAYKNVRAERDALKDANDRAATAEAERDRLREALIEIANCPSDQRSPESDIARAALEHESIAAALAKEVVD